jgi:hypothetical protein
MANDEAWQAGMDIAAKGKYGKRGKKAKDAESGGKALGDVAGGVVASLLPTLHKGGRVRKTGNYRLKKGEVVLTVAQQKAHGLKKEKRKSSSRKRVAAKR